jgi:peptide deformylase
MLIERPISIKVQYMDESLKDCIEEAHNFTARVLQH